MTPKTLPLEQRREIVERFRQAREALDPGAPSSLLGTSGRSMDKSATRLMAEALGEPLPRWLPIWRSWRTYWARWGA